MNFNNAILHFEKSIDRYLQHDQPFALPPMPASAEAFTVLTLARRSPTAVLWITRHPDHLEQGIRDLHTLAPTLDTAVLPFPPVFQTTREAKTEDLDVAGQRINTLNRLAELPPSVTPIIITSIGALLQHTLSPETLTSQTRFVEIDRSLDLSAISQHLADTGYQFESEVLDKGQASKKGGILDLWPPDSPWPVRIELFGNIVDSLRLFDPVSQRSVEKRAAILLTPAHESETANNSSPGCLLDHIRHPLTVVFSDPEAIRQLADQMPEEQTSGLFAFEDIQRRLQHNPGTLEVEIGADTIQSIPESMRFTPLINAVTLPATAGAYQLEQARQKLLDDLYARAARNHQVILYFDTEGSRDHFQKHLARDGAPALTLNIGRISEGFCCDAMRLTLVAESDLYGRRKSLQRFDGPNAGRGRAQRYAGSRINDFTDMEEDDLVVHVDHGVGRYLGVQQITFNGQLQEVLAIEYAEAAKLYVPMTHAHLLSRYVGMANRTATLHRLGGSRWAREKGSAQTAVLDLAAELLDIQARRNLLQGHAFPPDTPMQHELENAFAFQETADQVVVIRDVRADMESTRPMDRLICGDAGYGKTEVAMRAAFKAVQDGRQVAMLVPTTILAQQHYQTFSERMTGFSVRIQMISRFQTPTHRKTILKSLETGAIDIIIGTHALVQPGVRFKDLGLVIIDEEQRFGVAHKERLKKVKQLVDVLTLSATPIPRTLYMSMTGARDMSLLRTPPRERVPIETIMAKNTDEVVQEAIRRELGRDGQVYYLHNRIISIHRLRERVASLVPEARIEVAHGQMKSSELAAVMQRFIAGEIDVLLCTTIIESGMDIPRANTILIDRADRFGIADLYQLRGRVGRANRKAYAYLLLPSHGMIAGDARERIQAVRKHSGLSAGFNLAVRDMEIRGAGNILGSAQSGHISNVGFGLYCQLLQHAVAKLKGDNSAPIISAEVRLDFIRSVPDDSNAAGIAILPRSYISDERLRVAIYRRIAEATQLNAIHDLLQEITDRFGPPPAAAKRLLTIAELRLSASALDIQSIEVRDWKIIIKRNHDYLMQDKRFPVLKARAPDACINELLAYIRKLAKKT